jgi:hypothetical protein
MSAPLNQVLNRPLQHQRQFNITFGEGNEPPQEAPNTAGSDHAPKTGVSVNWDKLGEQVKAGLLAVGVHFKNGSTDAAQREWDGLKKSFKTLMTTEGAGLARKTLGVVSLAVSQLPVEYDTELFRAGLILLLGKLVLQSLTGIDITKAEIKFFDKAKKLLSKNQDAI